VPNRSEWAGPLVLVAVGAAIALGGLSAGAAEVPAGVEVGLFIAAAAALGASLHAWLKPGARLKALGRARWFGLIGIGLAVGVAVVRPPSADVKTPSTPPPPTAPASIGETTIRLSLHDRHVIESYARRFEKSGDKKTAGFLGALAAGAVTAGTLIKAIDSVASKGRIGLEAAKALLGILDGGISVSVTRNVHIDHPTLSLGGLYIGTRGPRLPPEVGARIVLKHPLFSLGTLRLQTRTRLVVTGQVKAKRDPDDPADELPRTR
jgi:hypothetical protein